MFSRGLDGATLGVSFKKKKKATSLQIYQLIQIDWAVGVKRPWSNKSNLGFDF